MATLQELIEYSKANPQSPVANKTMTAIKQGLYDAEAQQSGIDLSWAGRKAFAPQAPTELKSFGDIGKWRQEKKAEFAQEQATKEPLKQRLSKVLEEGLQKESEAQARRKAGEQGALETFSQVSGRGLTTAGEAAFEVLRSIPFVGEKIDEVGKAVQLGLQPIVESPKGQEAIQWYQNLDPRTKENMNTLVQFVSAIAGGGTGKAAAPVVKETFQAGKEAVETAATKAVQKTAEMTAGGITKLKEAPGAIKETITGVVRPSADKKIVDQAIDIAREKITPAYQEQAALEKRTFKEGKLGIVKYKPTRKEEILADSISDMVADGRIDPKALPFEQIVPIEQRVSQINQGVKQMIRERGGSKSPFNEKQLRSRLSSAKKDSSIIFASDPTLERVYDQLIEAFVDNVKKKDVEGLFDARQDFDKLPAVKKLLDGLKGAEGENLRRQAVLDIRRAANEYVSDFLPENNPYRAALKKESYMLEIIGNLAEKSKGLGGTTNIERFINANPILKPIIRNVVPFSVGGVVF